MYLGSTSGLSTLAFFYLLIVVLFISTFYVNPFRFLKRSKPLHSLHHLNDSQLLNTTCVDPDEIPPLLDLPETMPEALKHYADFHRNARRCIDNLANCSNLPKMIIWESSRRVSGGLGDRLIAIRNLLMLSIATRRLFLIQWVYTYWSPFALLSALYPTYINWHITPDEEEEIFKLPGQVAEFFKINYHHLGDLTDPFHPTADEPVFFNSTDLDKLFSNYSIIRVSHSTISPLTLFRVSRNNLLRKRLEGLTDLSLLELERHLSDFLFRPTEAVEFLTGRRTFPDGLPYIGVQVRAGADVGEEEDGRFKGLVEQYDNISTRFLTCVKRADEGKLKRVFLASDSRAFKDIFLKDAHKSGYDATTNARFVWHVDREKTDLFASEKDHCIAFLDVFADMYALSRAQTVMYFESNFPRISIGMGGGTKNWMVLERRTELRDEDCYPSTLQSEWDVDK